VALSRFDETLRQLVVELSADGTTYLAHGAFNEQEFASHWDQLAGVLRLFKWKLTRRDIHGQWPGPDRPDPATLYRWLRRGVEAGLLRQDGRGTRQHPFRYWLPETEDVWRQRPEMAEIMPELFQSPPRNGGPASFPSPGR
jgi:hypothetical protein